MWTLYVHATNFKYHKNRIWVSSVFLGCSKLCQTFVTWKKNFQTHRFSLNIFSLTNLAAICWTRLAISVQNLSYRKLNVALLGVNRRRHELVILYDLSIVINTAQHQIQFISGLQWSTDVRKRHQWRLAKWHFQVDGKVLLQRTLRYHHRQWLQLQFSGR